MRKSLATILFVCLLLPMGVIYRPDISDAGVVHNPGGLKIKPQTSKIQLPFIANEGQIDNKVKYYAQTFNGSFFITQNGELVYSIEKPQKTDGRKERSEHSVIREIFTGDIKSPSFKGEGEGAKISIYKGNEPAKWKRNIPSYERISLGDIYQGIEIKLKAYGDTIEKIFSVKPGADPKAIRSRLEGAKNIQVNEKGELELQTDIGTALFSKPVAYQVKGQGDKNKEQREYVQVSYSVEGDQYGFRVGDYDKTRELVIDPYVGVKIQGSAEDRAYAIIPYFDGDVDRVFVAGYSYSYNFPVNYAFGTSGTSDSDVFVAKLTEDLGTIEQIVFIAGTGNDFAYSLAMDSANNIYVAGTTTSSNLPMPTTSYDMFYNGGTDVFIAKLSYDLSSLISLTYLGGSSLDAVNADSLAIDGMNDNVIVAGYTTSTDFPTVTGDPSFDKTYNGGEDVFIAIFNTGLEGDPSTPGLETLKSSTFIGDTGNERPYAMALRTEYSTEIYVAGYTNSTNYPTTVGAYNTTYNGGTEDAFISRIMSLGYSPLENLASSTFLGGNGTDEIHGLAIDSFYNVYVTGNTDSSDLAPNFPGTCTHGSCGGMDVFIAQFGTFLTNTPVFVKLGGTSSDYGKSLILSGGMVYVSGVTYSYNFPLSGTYFDGVFGGTPGVNSDGFVLSIDPTLVNLDASTYLGGSADDFAPAIAVSASGTGDIYVAGSTNSTDFPTTLTSYGGSSGSFEAYVAKLDDMLMGDPCIYTIIPENNTVPAAGDSFSFSITTSTGCAWNASTEDSWITITAGSGSGSGTVNYTVSSNAGRVRQGAIDVAGKFFIVIQNGPGLSLTDPSTGHQYYRFDELLVRTAAQSRCLGLGGHLVTITSSSEQTFVYGNLVSGGTDQIHECWIGGVQFSCAPEPLCGWQWVTGETWGYTNWGGLEPNNANGNENSIVMLYSDGTWNDLPETSLQSFVCEWDTSLTYNLNVFKSGTGTGTVASTETPTPTINCGSTCSASYAVGTSVTLNAAASSDSVFAGWSGAGCSGTGVCDVTMDAAKAVTATFTKNSYTVTPQAGQGGSISPSSPQTVLYNGTALFTITPDTGYQIASVSGCGVTKYEGGVVAAKKKKKKKKKVNGSAAGEVYITGPITENCTISASFAINTFIVTPKAGEHGSMDPSTPQTVNYHDTVSFTVKPDAGYHIKSVSGCGVHPSEGGTYITDPVTGDCTVEAAFAKESFTVTILKSGTGGGAVTGNGITCEGNACGGTFEAGSKLTLKIKPDDGYRVIDVKINGKSIGPVQTITLKEILSNFTIEIVFGPA